MTTTKYPPGKRAIDAMVKRGMAYLDKERPGWEKEIGLGWLDLNDPCACVLGQIEGDFYRAVWKANMTKARAKACGFAASDGVVYRDLTAAWKKALKARFLKIGKVEQ